MGEPAQLTDREAAAVAFVVETALVDEEASEVRAALMRALAKLRDQVPAYSQDTRGDG